MHIIIMSECENDGNVNELHENEIRVVVQDAPKPINFEYNPPPRPIDTLAYNRYPREVMVINRETPSLSEHNKYEDVIRNTADNRLYNDRRGFIRKVYALLCIQLI